MTKHGEKFICSYLWPVGRGSREHKTFYVELLPGHRVAHNIDWGWTEDASKALPVSEYWVRRFKSYCESRGVPYAYSVTCAACV